MATRSKIFVSYRRSDSDGEAGRIAERLSLEFGSNVVFFDTESIGGGENFPSRLREELERALVVLIVIGNSWTTVADKYGRRRIDDERDWVRKEVARALAMTGVTVIPILVAEAEGIPPEEALPKDLVALSSKNALRIDNGSFTSDMQGLVMQLVKLGMVPMRAPAGHGVESIAPTSAVDWNAISSRYASEQRKSAATWAVLASFLVTLAVTAFAVLSGTDTPENVRLALPAFMLLIALTLIPKFLAALEKRMRSENLLVGLRATSGTPEYERWAKRAMEMYA